MRSADAPRAAALRVVLVGTGTGVGKTHVACALLAAWSGHARVVGLKPIETGIADVGVDEAAGRSPGRVARSIPPAPRLDALSDQERLARAAGLFHVKRAAVGARTGRRAGVLAPSTDVPWDRADAFHVKRRDQGSHARRPDSSPTRSDTADARPGHSPTRPRGSDAPPPHRNGRTGTARPRAGIDSPLRAVYAFPEPISPHLAARTAGIRIDPGVVDRWVRDHEAPITVIETAGGLFSPLGEGATNFDLLRALRPHAVILVAPDRLGVLHDLTATLGLVGARGGPALGVVLSMPATRDASTGRNADEIATLGIARPIAVFPRAAEDAPRTLEAARTVIAWIEANAIVPERQTAR